METHLSKTVQLAREAGWEMDDSFVLEPEVIWYVSQGQLERFAALVRADERDRAMRENAYVQAEREACAKVAEDSDHVVGGRGYYDQLGDADATVRNIAAAIRARGQP